MLRRSLVLALALAARSASADPDIEHAKQLYKAAEEAMDAARWQEAIDDFGGAYEITKDPVLFFKIGTANQKAGKCDVALVYFGRYLKEAHPTKKFVDLAGERIAECSKAAPAAVDKPPVAPIEKPPVVDTPIEPVVVEHPVAPPAPAPHPHGNAAAWLCVGGAIAFATIGAVLAYSASSSEDDISDLYVGAAGVPPTFDASTQKRYNDLVDEGHRYQYLSWASFGMAGGAAIAAAVLFATGHTAEETIVTPVASGNSVGAAATWHF
jgi:hypothetical protein